MTGRAWVLHLDRETIRSETARQARVHGIDPPSGAVVDAVTHLLGVMLDEHRVAVVKETIARVCELEGHRANDITGLDSTQLEYLCGRCGTRWNKDRAAAPCAHRHPDDAGLPCVLCVVDGCQPREAGT